MQIEKFTVGPLGTNCYIITCEKTGNSAIIDPGGISQELLENLGNLQMIILTHGHFDHIAGVHTILENADVPLLIHSEDASMLEDSYVNGSFLMGEDIIVTRKPEIFKNGDIIKIGECSVNVIHTPGHTRGSVSFYDNDNILISGDTLFKLSVGRWDLPGGDYSDLTMSLEKLCDMIDNATTIYPGHGPVSRMDYEKTHNRFLMEIR